ncbi:hypothetical protein B0H14DRAFT_3462617 [Mycena olivaceomarginata]|nr:hypothetical protein B0H14DRAFT_3462617 [Mycena olivaceomarginata]
MFLFPVFTTIPSFRSQLAPDNAALTRHWHSSTAALVLPPHSFVPPNARPPCIPDIAPRYRPSLHPCDCDTLTPPGTLPPPARSIPGPFLARWFARYPPLPCSIPAPMLARCSPPPPLPPPSPSIPAPCTPDSHRLCAQSLPVRPLPTAPALHPHLMYARYSLPPPTWALNTCTMCTRWSPPFPPPTRLFPAAPTLDPCSVRALVGRCH